MEEVIEDFGKPIIFNSAKMAPETKVILGHLRDYVAIIGKEKRFTAMEIMDYINDEEPHGHDITSQKIRSLFNNMITRGGIKRTVKNATAVHFQRYLLKTNQFIIESINDKRPQKKFKVESITEPKKVLTLEDAKNMESVDVAFIGYSIVTEMHKALTTIDVLEKEVARLKEDSTKEEVFRLKISDMEDKHGREVNILKEKISQLSQNVQKLNGQIVAKNTIIERLEKTRPNYNTGSTTFKMDELARLKGEKPKHLQD